MNVAAPHYSLESPPAHPTLANAARVWSRIGWLGFGGPAGQIALMHRELVEHRRWISEQRFLHALNYCMLLPGPEAQQLAIYIGWLMHRTCGGLIAGVLFVLPGALVLGVLSALYVRFGTCRWCHRCSSDSRRRCSPSSSMPCCGSADAH